LQIEFQAEEQDEYQGEGKNREDNRDYEIPRGGKHSSDDGFKEEEVERHGCLLLSQVTVIFKMTVTLRFISKKRIGCRG
jgi:hypothetical protein